MTTSAKGSLKDNQKNSYVESPTRPNQTAQEVVTSGNTSPFGLFDEIQVTYPSSTTEVFTYLLDSTALGTVTVTYTNNSKNFLSSVVYNEL